MTPERQAAITRQHSQEMALRTLSLGYPLPRLAPTEGQSQGAIDTDRLKATIRAMADFFDEDVARASGAATGAPQSQPAQPAPAPQAAPQGADAGFGGGGPHVATPTDDEIPFAFPVERVTRIDGTHDHNPFA